MSQITWMAKRLQELELIVSESRSVVDSAETPAPKLAPSPVSPESTSNSVEAHGPAPELPDLNVDANGRVGTSESSRPERASDRMIILVHILWLYFSIGPSLLRSRCRPFFRV